MEDTPSQGHQHWMMRSEGRSWSERAEALAQCPEVMGPRASFGSEAEGEA